MESRVLLFGVLLPACGLLGGRELQVTDIVPNTPFTIQIPTGTNARGVWIYFAHDQTTHFELNGEMSVTLPGTAPVTVPVRLSANQFV